MPSHTELTPAALWTTKRSKIHLHNIPLKDCCYFSQNTTFQRIIVYKNGIKFPYTVITEYPQNLLYDVLTMKTTFFDVRLTFTTSKKR